MLPEAQGLKLWLPEIALYYYKARMYSPTLGRFLQTDPIWYKDGSTGMTVSMVIQLIGLIRTGWRPLITRLMAADLT